MISDDVGQSVETFQLNRPIAVVVARVLDFVSKQSRYRNKADRVVSSDPGPYSDAMTLAGVCCVRLRAGSGIENESAFPPTVHPRAVMHRGWSLGRERVEIYEPCSNRCRLDQASTQAA